MIVHIDSEDLDFLLDNLAASIEGSKDEQWEKSCEKVFERVYKKRDQAIARNERKLLRIKNKKLRSKK